MWNYKRHYSKLSIQTFILCTVGVRLEVEKSAILYQRCSTITKYYHRANSISLLYHNQMTSNPKVHYCKSRLV